MFLVVLFVLIFHVRKFSMTRLDVFGGPVEVIVPGPVVIIDVTFKSAGENHIWTFQSSMWKRPALFQNLTSPLDVNWSTVLFRVNMPIWPFLKATATESVQQVPLFFCMKTKSVVHQMKHTIILQFVVHVSQQNWPRRPSESQCFDTVGKVELILRVLIYTRGQPLHIPISTKSCSWRRCRRRGFRRRSCASCRTIPPATFSPLLSKCRGKN